MSDTVGHTCPVPSAHRRLMDCHDHWHAALDTYMEPDAFRLNVNSLIQALRNVTFLLQKQKAELPEFESWYPEWQGLVRDDEVMRWSVRARNRIVKESDLELNSIAKVTVALDWLRGGEKTFTIPPRWGPRDIAAMLRQKGAIAPEFEGESVLTVERRWVDRLLPEKELLNACLHAMVMITDVVRSAHQAAGVTTCDLPTRSRECVKASLDRDLECMWDEDAARVERYDLATLTPYLSRRVRIERDEKLSREAIRRYGVAPDFVNGDPISMVDLLVEVGKSVLVADGFNALFVWLFRGDKAVDLQSPVFTNQAGKMMAFQEMATRAEMLNADGILLISEIWMATGASTEQVRGRPARAGERSDRTEALQVIAAKKDGVFRSVITPFERKDSEIFFLDPISEDRAYSMPMMRPLWKVWGVDDSNFEPTTASADPSSSAPAG